LTPARRSWSPTAAQWTQLRNDLPHGPTLCVQIGCTLIDDAKTYGLAPSEWRPSVADVIPVDWS
jgi:hypothetical protein